MCGSTARFVSGLVGNPGPVFSERGSYYFLPGGQENGEKQIYVLAKFPPYHVVSQI